MAEPMKPTYEQLEVAARELREILDEALGYVPDYFLEKWDLARPVANEPVRRCFDGSPVHDFKGQKTCPGCGWHGMVSP